MTQIHTLSNGIQVVTEPMNYLKSAAVGVWIKVGSAYEQADNNGIAHVIEHMVFKGTYKRDARTIADEMTAIGGNVDAYTTKESTSFYARTLKDYLPRAIDILSDMLLNSRFDEEDLKKELGVILEEIDMYDDSPEDIVHEQLQKAIWKDHPLGYLISGDKEVVRHFTRAQVLEFMNRYYVADRMLISVAGAFDENETLALLEKAFGGVPKGMTPKPMLPPVYHPSLYCQNKDIEQVHLVMAYDCITYRDAQRYVCTIVNNLLGGNLNSRLFQVIREELGLAYTVYSYGSAYDQAGLFQIYAAVNQNQVEEVTKAIIGVINAFKTKGITSHELAIAKDQIRAELILSSESTQNRMNFNGRSVLQYGTVVSLSEELELLEAITARDIADFANRYFQQSTMSLSLVGDLSGLTKTKTEHIWQTVKAM